MGEEGVIFDIKRYAIHDGPGIRTTVFFKGCPLDCWWCHNPEGKKPDPEEYTLNREKESLHEKEVKTVKVGEYISVKSLLEEVKKDSVFYEESGGGVTVSGGEPLMQPRFLEEFLKGCRAVGISTVLDTSGYAEYDTVQRMAGLADICFYDLKIMDDEEHIRYTGASNSAILENFKRLCLTNAKVIPRIALIPGYTDTADNIQAMISFLKETGNIEEVSLIPYNMIGSDKIRRFGLEFRTRTLKTQSGRRMGEVSRLFEQGGIIARIEG